MLSRTGMGKDLERKDDDMDREESCCLKPGAYVKISNPLSIFNGQHGTVKTVDVNGCLVELNDGNRAVELLFARSELDDGHAAECLSHHLSRQEANKKLLAILGKAVDSCPDLRFNQILEELWITEQRADLFYEESEKTLKRVESTWTRANSIAKKLQETTGRCHYQISDVIS